MTAAGGPVAVRVFRLLLWLRPGEYGVVAVFGRLPVAAMAVVAAAVPRLLDGAGGRLGNRVMPACVQADVLN